MDDEQIAAHLEKHGRFSGLAEVYKTYTAAFERRNCRTVEVTIQILRTLEGAWTVRVVSEDGKVAASNISPAPEMALAGIHWEHLE